MLAFATLLLIIVLVLVAASIGRLRQIQADIQKQADELHGLRRQIHALIETAVSPGTAGAATPKPAAPPPPSPLRVDALAPAPAATVGRPSDVPTVPSAVMPPPPHAKPAATPPPLPGVPPQVERAVPASHAPTAPATAPAVPPPPKPKSRLVESAGEVLHKLWNWIVVGEEHRPQGVTVEYAVATTWSMRLGILIFVLGVAFLLVWSSQRQLIGPIGRVAIALFTGVAMLVGGVRLLGKKYHVMGQGLLGGGILVLYFGVYAMGPRYALVSIPAAFGLMALVSVAAGLLALRLDSMLVAIIGLAGGYLTPVLLHSDVPRLDILYAYMLLLGVAILALSCRKQWRLLNYLSFLCTYALFIASLDAYDRTRNFPIALGFLCAFFAIQSSLVYVYNILRRKPSTTLEIIHTAANALLFAAIGYWLILDAHGRPYPAFLALGLGAFFTLHVLLLLRRRIDDRPLVVTFIALAGAFATWALPLVMENESLTIALALLAFTFLWLGHKLGSRFLQNLAHALYLVVLFRLGVWDFERNYTGPADRDPSLHAYWSHALHRLWTFGISLASVTGAFILQRRQPAPAPTLAVPPKADTPLLLGSTTARRLFFWATAVILVAFLNFEFWAMFACAPPWRYPALTIVWCATAVYFLRAHAAEARPGAMFWAMTGALTIAAVKILGVDLAFWHCRPSLVYGVDYHPLDAAARGLDFGALLLANLLVWRMVRRRADTRATAPLFGYAALALLFLYTTLEWHTLLYWKVRRFQEGGLSILWALFGIAYIVGGIWRNRRPLRFLGLALMVIVIAKVFFFDLSGMETIVRVVAFLVVGVLLLLSSFAYMYSSKKFARQPPPPPPVT
ncbi:MAG: DUF2339 domain-containing protein [Lentisphaerae bacterium]|nr:DUF2339 domain-containing protein [Lentisphaerota bacterium]